MKDHLSVEVEQADHVNRVTLTFTPVAVSVNIDLGEADYDDAHDEY